MIQARMQVDELSMYYEIHGSGEPLLLIAGLASDSRSWAPILPALSSHFQVIIFDNRGSGQTRPMNIPLDIPHMADDCKALLDHLHIPSAHLLGHSMGGMIAMECACRHPECVNKIIIAATAAKPSARDIALIQGWADTQCSGMAPEYWFKNFFYWIFTTRFFNNPAIVEAALQYALNDPFPQSPKAFRHQVNAITEFDITNRLKDIHAPTLLIQGEQDIFFPPAQSRRELSPIHGLHSLIIPDAAHSIHLEAPGSFTDAVLSFLQP